MRGERWNSSLHAFELLQAREAPLATLPGAVIERLPDFRYGLTWQAPRS